MPDPPHSNPPLDPLVAALLAKREGDAIARAARRPLPKPKPKPKRKRKWRHSVTIEQRAILVERLARARAVAAANRAIRKAAAPAIQPPTAPPTPPMAPCVEDGVCLTLHTPSPPEPERSVEVTSGKNFSEIPGDVTQVVSNEPGVEIKKKVEIIGPQAGPQERFLMCGADIAIYGGAAGGGKMLSIETAIATRFGWKKMEELKEGDEVFGEEGRRCRVVVAYPIMESVKGYRMVFDDGSEIEACGDHMWKTITVGDLGGEIRTTREIAATLRTKSGRVNHAIPVALPLELSERELPFDPYLFGVWLGDGTSIGGSITTADAEVVQSFRDKGFEVKKWKDKYGWGIYGFYRILRLMGVLENKHIPMVYLRASADQRLALLQGLMDTDGCSCKSGSVEFTSTRRNLVEGVKELICSLGMKANIGEGRAMLKGKDCGPKWRIHWTSFYPMFRLKRKLDRQKIVGLRRTTRFRYIVACNPIAPKPMRCITVDNPSGLYLCGRSMIPTHNTYGLLLEPLRHLENREFGAVIFRRTVPQITKEGAMWDQSTRLYGRAKAVPNKVALMWKFPSGMRVSFAHLQLETDVDDWHGTEVPLLCCEVGTEVLMGDGGKKCVERIEIGDLVMTLRGPRSVKRIHAPQLEECVEAVVRDSAGVLIGSQVQAKTHRVLSPDGWVSYADMFCEPHLFSICESRESRCVRKCVARSDMKFLSRGRQFDSSSCHSGPRREFLQWRWDHQFGLGTVACMEQGDLDNCCELFPWNNQEREPQPSVHLPVIVVEQFPDSWGHDCAVFKGLPLGDQGRVQIRNLHRLRYAHPYTGEERIAELGHRIESCCLTPVGLRNVVHLAVDDESHYITASGLVNRNCFDELTHFTRRQFEYLIFSRGRTICGVVPYVRATCNPDPDSWVKQFIGWWLNGETGFPRLERSGVLRWMARAGDTFVWFDSQEEGRVWLKAHGDEETIPKSVTFIASRVYDNKILLEQNPEYLSNLNMLDAVTRAQLKDGNWNARPSAGLFLQEDIDKHRVVDGPRMSMVVVGVDPPAKSLATSDNAGIVVVGRDAREEPHYYVQADASLERATPEQWGGQAVAAYNRHLADRIVAEDNNGGEMVEHTIKVVDARVVVKRVHATRGKVVRAEPVAVLLKKGRLHMMGAFPELERELCNWDPNGSYSPGRLDALVWAITEMEESPNLVRGAVAPEFLKRGKLRVIF